MGEAVDTRTDLYALGVMLYQMASGRLPFEAVLTGTMLLAHAHETPAPIQSLAPDLPPPLARLIMQLLEKDPGARPASAAEVSTRLAGCLPGAPRASRTWLAVLAAVLLAAGAVIAYLAIR
jgi:serine/threonine protein kinase